MAQKNRTSRCAKLLIHVNSWVNFHQILGRTTLKKFVFCNIAVLNVAITKHNIDDDDDDDDDDVQ